MSESDPRIQKQQTPNWANARAPAVHRVGKWERRVWIVCFWATFIMATIQALIVGFLLLITHWRPAEPFVWWFVHEQAGVIVDSVLAIITAPLAMYSFAMARQGVRRSWPLYCWLISRIACAAILVICELNLWFIGNYVRALIGVFMFRVVLLNIPIWCWLIGLGVIRWERSRLKTTMLDSAVPQVPAPPIDPLA